MAEPRNRWETGGEGPQRAMGAGKKIRIGRQAQSVARLHAAGPEARALLERGIQTERNTAAEALKGVSRGARSTAHRVVPPSMSLDRPGQLVNAAKTAEKMGQGVRVGRAVKYLGALAKRTGGTLAAEFSMDPMKSPTMRKLMGKRGPRA